MITAKQITAARSAIKKAKSLQELEKLKRYYLGRKGLITEALRSVGGLEITKRAHAGKTANEFKLAVEKALEEQYEALENQAEDVELKTSFDLTTPGKGVAQGHLHPIESLQQELIQIFWQLGFSVADGPEVESDWYCFEALNIPADHPARDMQDTFYLESGAIPRTHTSSVQIRYMENHKPPIRIIAPGKVYRNEDEDMTHIWAFRQLEALVVDKDVSLTDLKGTILYMLRGVFGEDAELRLRPNYFPYTEPSLEVDARLNPNSPWLELGGAGMVHPQVLRNVGIDPEVYSGFAFGFGLERLASIKYGVDDLRHFWRTNLKFLEQF